MPSRRPRPPAPESRTAGRRRRAFVLLAACLAFGLACRTTGDADAEGPTEARERAAEIERLEARIEADRETLARFVTTPRDLEAAPFHEDEGLRAIAERLTADTARLERLRAATDPGAAQ